MKTRTVKKKSRRVSGGKSCRPKYHVHVQVSWSAILATIISGIVLAWLGWVSLGMVAHSTNIGVLQKGQDTILSNISYTWGAIRDIRNDQIKRFNQTDEGKRAPIQFLK